MKRYTCLSRHTLIQILIETISQSDDGYPEARRCHSAIQIGEIVWIFGGYDGEEVFGDIWRLNMITFQWTKIQIDLPLPVYFHAMTASNEGKMIMFGGVDDYEKNTRTSRKVLIRIYTQLGENYNPVFLPPCML